MFNIIIIYKFKYDFKYNKHFHNEYLSIILISVSLIFMILIGPTIGIISAFKTNLTF